MMADAEIQIGDLFTTNRFPKNGWKWLAVCLYSPCGLVLAVLRFFILIQAFLATVILPEKSTVKGFILRIMSIVLGMVIQEEDEDHVKNSAQVIVSNHVTLFDHIPLHLVTGCVTPSFPRLNLPLIWGLKSLGASRGRQVLKERLEDLLDNKEFPLLFLPEEGTTNGKVGLLKFSSWYGFAAPTMQPVCLEVHRPPFADITPNVLQSSAITDLFWFLFVPFTVYKVMYLPVIQRNPLETEEDMIDRIESVISNKLGITKTNFTASDKAEYLKRYIADLNKPQPYAYPSPKFNRKPFKIRMEEMTAQVKEVLPHVPVDVIFKDLIRTKHVDFTIANILEGRVDYVPVPSPDEVQYREEVNVRPSTSKQPLPQLPNPGPSSQSSVPFPKSAQDRMLSLVERKKHMIEAARKKYMERHGISYL